MKPPLIGLGISAVLLLLSFGLCGAGAANEHSNTQSFLVGAGLVGMAISVLGGAVSFVWLIVALIRQKN